MFLINKIFYYLCGEIVGGNCPMKGEVPTLSHHSFGTLFKNGTMKEIILNNGMSALVDDNVFDFLNQWNWYADRAGSTYYAKRQRMINGKSYKIYMHRVIMSPPHGLWVDHIDHNGLNNQVRNLRICNRGQNLRNFKSRRGSSKYVGVYINNRGKAIAYYNYNSQTRYIGSFDTEDDAAIARDKKILELGITFSPLNFPNINKE